MPIISSSVKNTRTKKPTSSLSGAPPTSGGGVPDPPAHISCGAQVVSLKELSRGYDTLHLTYRQQVPLSVISLCRAAKAALFEGHNDTGYVDLGVMRLAIARNGVKNYPYVLSTGDITIMISSRRPGTMPTAEIHMGSISSQSGPKKILLSIKREFAQIGMKFEKEKVCRVDYAVDFEGTVQDVLEQFSVENFITYATKIFPHYTHGKLTGVQLGKGDNVIVIYDKTLEIKEKKDFEKMEYFKKKWGGEKEKVVRVEVRLRGQAIRQLLPKKRRYYDINRAITRIWTYMTREWCRYTKGVDRENKNQSKARVTDGWSIVQKIFNYADPSRVVSRTIVHSSLLIKQAIGCLATVVSATGLGIHSPGAVWRTMQDMLNEGLFPLMFDPAWQHKYESKRAKNTVCF